MYFRILGSSIEYDQAAKRLEELADAAPGTLQARERQELIYLFQEFEKEIKAFKQNGRPKNRLSWKDFFQKYFIHQSSFPEEESKSRPNQSLSPLGVAFIQPLRSRKNFLNSLWTGCTYIQFFNYVNQAKN